ncbi:MAG: ubiquinone/menaquinone biosynthesis methyltransferase [Deltaproteobacteria bacterium]|nr:ubiquinone/menaquinone biosynthesis methyltransferase [Deltaproteobacteria bacterium]
MFGEISGRYVLMNRIITLGRDSSWRRRLVDAAALPRGGVVLDVGSGTGDILLAALRRDSTMSAIALDFSTDMVAVGRRRKGGRHVFWCCGNAGDLPFPDAAFDRVVSGYLLRNVEDVRRALREQIRVVKPGGRVVALDTSPPPRGFFRPAVLFYSRFVIPLLGRVIARNRAAYEYLPASTQAFLRPEALARIMEEVGLRDVRFHRFMMGTQVLLVGDRSLE